MIDYLALPDNKKYVEVTERRYIGFRGRHWLGENGRATAYVGAPAIIPPYSPTVALPMTKEIQIMSFELMKRFCPTMSGNRWKTLHGYTVAMNNGSQNGYGDIPHADYVNNIDLSASLPRYDKMQRVFQGSFITGTLEGDGDKLLLCIPGIDAIDATKPMPTVDEIVDNNWYSIAVCTGNPPFHFRPAWGGQIVYPFILDRPIYFEAKYFTSWNETFLPNPLKIYL